MGFAGLHHIADADLVVGVYHGRHLLRKVIHPIIARFVKMCKLASRREMW